MTLPAPGEALAERIATWAAGVDPAALPEEVSRVARRQLLDTVGLCVAARRTDYVEALLETCEPRGHCTAIGHRRGVFCLDAALINGTAAHGEDYDDTFEGTPVHTAAVVVPAVLAACERYQRGGSDLLRGIAVGVEFMCRMALVVKTGVHRAGFHPTAVIGALGATLGAGTALGLPPQRLASALGIAGSMASGIIEYLAEGTSTKRLHAGWAAQCGIRAALMAQAGFSGPRTVIEGQHGFVHAFCHPDIEPEFGHLSEGLGSRWLMEGIAFKPYACGTMAQPFIDCALALRASGMPAERIRSITCKVGEGTVHRLWEPLAEKRRPTTAYSAKFSVPFCIAVGFVDGAAGLSQFTESRVADPRVIDVASRVDYEIDPLNQYPANYTGHLRVEFADGSVREFDQRYLRGGRRAPLSADELAVKYQANARFGGWGKKRTAHNAALCEALFESKDLTDLRRLRG
ncbi:MAG: MmgE/PrpD family protein [Betaproteobacteria bacterium]|nr:MmgE/PrpD family protein [Betaproteobacteria bacterium]